MTAFRREVAENRHGFLTEASAVPVQSGPKRVLQAETKKRGQHVKEAQQSRFSGCKKTGSPQENQLRVSSTKG